MLAREYNHLSLLRSLKAFTFARHAEVTTTSRLLKLPIEIVLIAAVKSCWYFDLNIAFKKRRYFNFKQRNKLLGHGLNLFKGYPLENGLGQLS